MIYLILNTAVKPSSNQEIYRPGTAISDASNLCTAVGGDQNKEFKGNASEYIAIVGYAHHDL